MHQQNQHYANQLTNLALQLVAAVHDDGPQAVQAALTAARKLPAPRGIDPYDALTITLAALINPNARRSELLTHLGHDIAHLYPNHRPGPEAYRCNAIAVEMALRGRLPACALNPAELVRVTAILASEGLDADDIADHLDATARDIHEWTTRQAAAA